MNGDVTAIVHTDAAIAERHALKMLSARTWIALVAAENMRQLLADGWTRHETVSGFVLTPPTIEGGRACATR